ncbi:hypothetical protein P7D22_11625 [Lichenihabitans sp. Uapishka_5]|uniref:hypothetical protein n=1 Tax=Lichenihabitans sp. Uapishka_5 TaxID=3037302 RepID=UPI0029E7ECCB|nr:hypothetical protein [Lichenihabitans sp. Uapishka_5]MDX7951819.1 hypothetical protein [Lichenihabitans sp. Uapishka_5]
MPLHQPHVTPLHVIRADVIHEAEVPAFPWQCPEPHGDLTIAGSTLEQNANNYGLEQVDMIEEGARVKLRPESLLGRQHPEMLGTIGIVGSIVRGSQWRTLVSRQGDGTRDVSMHIRFRELNLVALNVPANDVEAVDHLNPELQEH